MLDIINRRSLFITNITGHTPGKYSWKSYPVQSDSLAIDNAAASCARIRPERESEAPSAAVRTVLRTCRLFMTSYP